MFTLEELKEATPKKLRNNITPEFTDTLNNMGNTEFMERYKENYYGYQSVLEGGRYKLIDYANAVKFVSYRVMDHGVTESYRMTFPDRYRKMVSEGTERKNIASVASGYNKTKLVTGIFERTLIAPHILNADVFQKAVNKLVEVIDDQDASHRSIIDASNTLLTHLKPPEVSKVLIDVGSGTSDLMSELLETTAALAMRQKQILEDSIVSTKDIAEMAIIAPIDDE